MSVTATSRVATERGERYRKQLASHFGSKIEVVEEPAGTVLKWGFGGSTTLTVEASALVMRADAEDAETLDRVKDVTGRHLERFGEKDGLVVTWQSAGRALPRRRPRPALRHRDKPTAMSRAATNAR